MHRVVIGILAVLYFLVMAFFAFRPFQPIRGLMYAPADIQFEGEAVHIRRDASLEGQRDVRRVYDALVSSGQMSLEIALQTDSLSQFGAANIFGLARNNFNRNFTFGQEGHAIVFRMRTSETDSGGLRGSMVVPKVIDPDRKQHVVLSYDGFVRRLFVDGILTSESAEVQGNFGNWGRNHLLVAGDLPAGGDGWAGRIWRIAVYDRALDSGEVRNLFLKEDSLEPVVAYEFDGEETGQLPDGLRPLRYRNLFVIVDSTTYDLYDGIFNIAGFVPLGMFVYLLLPLKVERRKVLAVIMLPVLAGLVVSGTIEFLQRYVISRVPCAPDLVYNVTGSLLGSLLAWLFFSTFKSKSIDESDR